MAEDIKQKHKFVLRDFQVGDALVMYGVLIGKAVLPITKGTAITVKNVKHASAKFNDSKKKFLWTTQMPPILKAGDLAVITEKMVK